MNLMLNLHIGKLRKIDSIDYIFPLYVRCRMGVNKSGKLVKRGPVQVTLKEIGEKRQMIIRSDDTLGN